MEKTEAGLKGLYIGEITQKKLITVIQTFDSFSAKMQNSCKHSFDHTPAVCTVAEYSCSKLSLEAF